MVSNRLTGMRAFYVVALGQFISIVGTTMTQFGLTIWSWKFVTEIQPVPDPATAMALVGFFNFAPEILMSPLAGALSDRWNRKLVMIISDVAAGLATIAIFLLYASGNLQMWHLYVAGAWTSAFKSFQWPAYSAAISTMIPKDQYTRADALLGLTESLSGILAPPLAGLLLGIIGLAGIMTIDIVSFLAAVGGILLVTIPQPVRSQAGRAAQGSLWRDLSYGFRYIFQHPSLLGLQLVFLFGNLLISLTITLVNPMILERTANNEVVLSLVQAALGAGAVIGGLVLVRTGGLKRRVNGVLGGWIVSSICGTVIFGIGQTLVVWAVFGLLASIANTYINASNQSIWQSKVAPDVQGRVFSTRRVIAQLVIPVGILLAGPLTDRVFEPAMRLRELGSPLNFLLSGPMLNHAFASARLGDGWTETFGWLVGVGPGAGMALLFVITGLLAMFVGVIGYLVPVVRNAEDILPDHDVQAAQAAS